MIYVTHDQVEAMTMADKIVVLNAGHIEQVGSPLELYNKPDNIFVAGFIGSPRMNFATGDIAAGFNAHTIGFRLSISASPRTPAPGRAWSAWPNTWAPTPSCTSRSTRSAW